MAASAGMPKTSSLPYAGRFNSEGELKRFEQEVRSSPRKEQTFYTIGCGFLQVGALPQAEEYLGKAVAANPNDAKVYFSLSLNRFIFLTTSVTVKAKVELAEVYKAQGKLIEAIDIFERQGLLACPTTKEFAYNAVKLRVTMAIGQAKNGIDTTHNLCLGIRMLKRVRTWDKNQFLAAGLDILANMYRVICEQAIPLSGELLEETVFISSQTESLSRPALHRGIFQALLASKITSTAAINYFEAHRQKFRSDLDWYLKAFRRIKVLEASAAAVALLSSPSKKEGSVLDPGRKLKLDVLYRVAFLCVTQKEHVALSERDENNAVFAYEQAIEELDSIIPNAEAQARVWTIIRQEHASRVQLLLALKGLKGLRESGIDGMALRSENRPRTFGNILRALSACLSFRPSPDPKNGLSKESIAERLSCAAHATLSITSCFTKDFLCCPQTQIPTPSSPTKKASFEALIPNPRDTDGGLPVGVGCRLPYAPSDPMLCSVDESVEETVRWPPGLLEGLRWVQGKVPVKKDRMSFIQADEEAFMDDPWDLERVACEYWKIKTLYPTRSDRSIPRRPTATIVDMEAFLIILITQRMHALVLEKFAATSGDVLYLSLLGFWQATELQRGVWWKALTQYSKSERSPLFAPKAVSEAQFHQALLEIRGSVRPDSRFLPMVFANVGLTFADMALTAGPDISEPLLYGASPAKSPHVLNARAAVEATHYLTVAGEWSTRLGVADWIHIGEMDDLLVLVDMNVAEYSELYCSVEAEAVDVLRKLAQLPQPTPERIQSDTSRQLSSVKSAPSLSFFPSNKVAHSSPSSRQGPAFRPAIAPPSMSTREPPTSDFVSLSVGNGFSSRSSPSGMSVRSAFSRISATEARVHTEASDRTSPTRVGMFGRLGSDSDDGWVRDGYDEESDPLAENHVKLGHMPIRKHSPEPPSSKRSAPVWVAAKAAHVDMDDDAPPTMLLEDVRTASAIETPILAWSRTSSRAEDQSDWEHLEHVDEGDEVESEVDAEPVMPQRPLKPRLQRQLEVLTALNRNSPLKSLATAVQQ
ncbi:hypothetical protein HDU67_004031 [Dinochytrium kinnereticum]|nr:hypothetical protein HDU67_004031 [Dinochytrium kinnereticum]